MLLSPRWISFIVSILISGTAVAFLSFIPGSSKAMYFVVGISSFIISFLLIFYIIDLLVFQEVNQIYKTISELKINDFSISRKSLIRSVNPLKKLNREIYNYASKKQEEIETLQQMELFRREFIANVSHDLKTPIFAAQGFIHTLLDGAMDDPKVAIKFLGKAAKSLDGLEILVQDILVLSQVESGEIKMNLEKVNLNEIIHEIFEQLDQKAQSKSILLSLNTDPNVTVFADKLRISQVLTNLIINGIIYGKENGSVIVDIQTKNGFAQIIVRDNGIGISQEHLSRIFERFYRVDKSRSRAVGGTGLGLAIVKHILNAHDTSIEVSSKTNLGTTFTFQLPLASGEIN